MAVGLNSSLQTRLDYMAAQSLGHIGFAPCPATASFIHWGVIHSLEALVAAVRTYMRITICDVDGEFLSHIGRSWQIVESKLKIMPERDWWCGVS